MIRVRTADRDDSDGEQLELTLGPLYVVVVDDRVSGPLTGRPDAPLPLAAAGAGGRALPRARCCSIAARSSTATAPGAGRCAGGQRHVAIVERPGRRRFG